jgi:hypothetical protein
MGRKKTKSRRRQRTIHKRRRTRSKRGGCGCGKSSLIGGSANANANLGQLPYEYNENPDYLSDQMKGGKKLKGGFGGIASVVDLQSVGQLFGVSQPSNEVVTEQPAAKIFHDNQLP